MSKKKTSFKELLSKGASNPRINVQNVRDQRQKLDTLKRSGQPAAASAQPPAKRATTSSDAPALLAPKTSATAGGRAAFVYAPTFAGLRPGYAFKTGPQGVGYYLEDGAGATAAVSAEEEVAMPFSQPPQHSLGQRSFAAIAAEEEAEAEAEAEEAAAGTVLLARRLRLPLPLALTPTPSPTPDTNQVRRYRRTSSTTHRWTPATRPS